MSKHNDIYSILGKLNSLEPKAPTAKQPVTEDNSSTFKKDLVQRLSESYVAEKDMGKHNNATTGFKALAKKAGGGEKGERIAGAQFQKMKKAGQLEEEPMDARAAAAAKRAEWARAAQELIKNPDQEYAAMHAKRAKELDDLEAQRTAAAKKKTWTPPTARTSTDTMEESSSKRGGKRRLQDALDAVQDDGPEMLIYHAIAAMYGNDMWDNDAMGDLVNDLEQVNPTEDELKYIVFNAELPPRLKNTRFTNTDDVQFGHLGEADMDEDMLSKPDYVDLDKDGNKKEPMKKAAKDAKKTNEGYDDITDQGEYDREGEMADQDLETAEDAAEELRSILDADENLPEWVQAKITKAVDYLDTARDYMQSKDSGEEVQEGEYKDSPNKSDVPAFQRKAKGGDWKVSTKDLDDEASKSPTGSAGLAKAKERLGMKEGQTIQTKTGLIHKGSYGSDYQGSDEEDDDYGSSTSSTGEKKRGRPRIHAKKDPDAPKRGRGRPKKVAEHINLSTFVEDTLAEMAAIYEGKPDFLDMDKDGDKEEPMKKAIGDKWKPAKTSNAFTQTAPYPSFKKKNPVANKVKETKDLPGKQLNESSLQAIVRKFGKEVREFAQGGDMDNDLFEALYDYYFDDMPYGVKKARDGDPYEWVADHFDQALQQGDVEVSETNMPAMEGDMELDELARLAGLHGGQKKLDRNHNNKLDSEDFAMLRQGTDESECNMTAEGDMCAKHGFAECWSASMMESKPDFLDMDKDGDKKEPMKKAVADKEDDKEDLDECGEMGPISGGMTQPESSMNINTSLSSKGDKSVNVTATGQEADKLMQLLKLAGIGGQSEPHSAPRVIAMSAGGEEAPSAEVEVEEEYGDTDVNAVPQGVQSPKPEYGTVKQQMQQGADLNRPKAQYKHNYKGGDNPMGMREETMKLESRLAAEYEYLKKAK